MKDAFILIVGVGSWYRPKLYILNMFSLLCISYISIKLMLMFKRRHRPLPRPSVWVCPSDELLLAWGPTLLTLRPLLVKWESQCRGGGQSFRQLRMVPGTSGRVSSLVQNEGPDVCRVRCFLSPGPRCEVGSLSPSSIWWPRLRSGWPEQGR